jgi:RNA polymerase sigma-70 factor (ECF subfamily)
MTIFEFHAQLLNLEHNLKGFAYHLTLKKADAEDLVQETCLKVLLNKDKYVIHDNFKGWAFSIMRNTYINIYRRSLYKQTWHDENRDSYFLNHIKYISSDNPNSACSVSEMTQCIDQLKEPFRIPFKMHINGYKYKEIADKLNLNIGTIKSRIFLSRKQLMNQLNR